MGNGGRIFWRAWKRMGAQASLAEIRRDLAKEPIFVFSLSEEADLLSQWRGYCPDGAGCSIGFETVVLKQRLPELQVWLDKCIYNEKDQVKSLFDMISEERKYPKVGAIPHLIQAGMAALIPLIKHPKFKMEREWRLVKSYKSEGERIKYRMGKSMIVPFYEMELKPLPISHLKLGPCPHPVLSKSALERLVEMYGWNAQVTNSEIPYRSW